MTKVREVFTAVCLLRMYSEILLDDIQGSLRNVYIKFA